MRNLLYEALAFSSAPKILSLISNSEENPERSIVRFCQQVTKNRLPQGFTSGSCVRKTHVRLFFGYRYAHDGFDFLKGYNGMKGQKS